MKKLKINQNVKAEKTVLIVKNFDHDNHKVQIFRRSYKTVQKFETMQF